MCESEDMAVPPPVADDRFDALARELIRAWRGRRSQRDASHRLGYRTNVVNGWESGRRSPTAAVALGMARRSGVDLDAALARFYRVAPAWAVGVDLASADGVARLLRDLRGEIPIGALAERAGCSRFSASRWLSGRAEPSLQALLALVHAATGRAAEYAASLADPRRLPSVRALQDTVAARMALARREPWAQAVLSAVCLHSYGATAAHDDGWLAARLGVDASTVGRVLATLADAGQIQWDGAHWEAAPVFSQDTAGDPDAVRRFKDHWAAEGVRRLPTASGGDLFSTNVLTASAADLEALRALHVAYFRAVHDVVSRSEGPLDRVLVVNTQLFDLATR